MIHGNKNCVTLTILLAGFIIILTGVVLGIFYFLGPREDKIEWTLTILGKNGQVKELDYEGVKDLPSVKARGGFFSTVGVVYGPYDVKGVPIETLCNLVGGFTASDLLVVSASDGYSSVYDYEQVKGGIDTFTPDLIKLTPHTEIRFLLIYEQEGRSLSDADGRPLRLAITCPDDLITEGHWWVKWVDRIEVRSLPPVK